MEAFRWGAPPHAGASVGLERLLMLLLNLRDIRLASLFYRDLKSFPASHLQPLEHLIANYGDATSTSWADDRFKIWRDMRTGAAIAYVPSSSNYVVVPGNPLCNPRQYSRVISQLLQWLRRSTKYKPVWIMCSPDVEAMLGKEFRWRSLSCIAEERVDPYRNLTASDGEIAGKIRRSENKGIKLLTMRQGEMVSQEAREKIDKGIDDWLFNRKGAQAHLSKINPWHDHSHLWGMQVKYSFDFPGSPNGVIEHSVTHAIQVAAKSGVRSLTFGTGATPTLTLGHNLQGAKVKILQHTYEILIKLFHLVRKSEFRQKLGAVHDSLFISFPPHGLGSKGIRAILHFFEE